MAVRDRGRAGGVLALAFVRFALRLIGLSCVWIVWGGILVCCGWAAGSRDGIEQRPGGE